MKPHVIAIVCVCCGGLVDVVGEKKPIPIHRGFSFFPYITEFYGRSRRSFRATLFFGYI